MITAKFPMPADTLLALRGSIAKWEAIVAGTGADWGIANCPLCKLFFRPTNEKLWCQGCPVFDATGEVSCHDTPYENYITDPLELHGVRIKDLLAIDQARVRPLAQAELDFLRSLLPEEEAP